MNYTPFQKVSLILTAQIKTNTTINVMGQISDLQYIGEGLRLESTRFVGQRIANRSDKCVCICNKENDSNNYSVQLVLLRTEFSVDSFLKYNLKVA